MKLKFPVSAHRRRRILPTCYFFSAQTLKVGETKLRCCSRSQKGLKGTRRKVAASLSLSLFSPRKKERSSQLFEIERRKQTLEIRSSFDLPLLLAETYVRCHYSFGNEGKKAITAGLSLSVSPLPSTR